ncbi:hypothetical protein Aros01_06669 [Streptosporangium roseum]|uniref:Uncharacterized protein n=2 Tax=Streptosporangium roseum TaxID=2001 RepID=D2BFQ1_STRRD|nr:hypothetical protein Sros_7531 [Streptosporangium roseum DSM 43021]
MINMLHKMGVRSGMMYAAGVASIGLSFASWLTSQSIEKAGTDRADRWGIFVGQWAPTFFAVGIALRIEETHADSRAMSGEMFEGTYAEGKMPSRAGV